MSYDDDSATVLHRGTAFFHSFGNSASRNAILLNGVLFAISFNEILSYDDDLEEEVIWPDPQAATILVSHVDINLFCFVADVEAE